MTLSSTGNKCHKEKYQDRLSFTNKNYATCFMKKKTTYNKFREKSKYHDKLSLAKES